MARPSTTNDCEEFVTIEGFLIAHGATLIVPLSVVEGPIVSIVTGLLSAFGYVRWYWALCLLVCGDLIGDLICYWAGRTAGTPLAGLCRRFGPRCMPGPDLQRDLVNNSWKMLLIGKWTHTFGYLILIGSGMLRLPLARFMFVNLLATIPKSAVLFGIGYFAGNDYPLFERHWTGGTILLGIMGGSALLLIVRRAGLIRARQ
jgi:membrane-associated protein